ncbi:tetraspanin-3-like isoform X2 [Thrips palmi]|uniref:Tetraspanin n=1 Tax=Thrips palmi TaxID=161013 RepID=A0A6P8ZXG8_THRPL|nr:tetraspanin-3-like isoform X2 [Thrips palmi]
MAVGCGTKCAKSILISFNMLFWLSGGTLLVLGAWVFLDPAKAHLFHLVSASQAKRDVIYYLAYALLAIGGSILVIGFCGCCGALHERRCMIGTYVVFLLFLVAVEMGVAVITFVFREEFMEGLEARLSDQLVNKYGLDIANHYESNNVANKDFTTSVDFAQYRFNCCGMRNDSDYQQTKWWARGREKAGQAERPRNVPLTCCVLSNSETEEPWQSPQPKQEQACQDDNPRVHERLRYKQGCLLELVLWFRRESTVLVACCTSIAGLQLLGVVLSLCLCRNIAEDASA